MSDCGSGQHADVDGTCVDDARCVGYCPKSALCSTFFLLMVICDFRARFCLQYLLCLFSRPYTSGRAYGAVRLPSQSVVLLSYVVCRL